MTAPRFDNLQVPPKDPILGVKEEFLADAATAKINLSVGAYRTDDGTPWVLPPVAEARKRLIQGTLEHEYLRALHNVNDEPSAATFDFAFEEQGVTERDLRTLIWAQLQKFHPELGPMP